MTQERGPRCPECSAPAIRHRDRQDDWPSSVLTDQWRFDLARVLRERIEMLTHAAIVDLVCDAYNAGLFANDAETVAEFRKWLLALLLPKETVS